MEGGCTPLVAAVRGPDAALRMAEQRAGEFVVGLVDERGLTLHQVVDSCDGAVTFADVARMRRAPQSRETPQAPEDGGSVGVSLAPPYGSGLLPAHGRGIGTCAGRSS